VRVTDGRLRKGIWNDVGADPVWSPDGKTIAFSENWPSGTLWTVRPNGTDLHRLKGAGKDVWAPTWSPDSRRIAYLSGFSNTRVRVVNADGSDAHTVLQDVYGPVAWSPDSERLALIQLPPCPGSAPDCAPTLYTIGVGGRSRHLIATGELEYEYDPPAWAP
jgi:Tol biopolymer transport system component